MLIAHYSHRLPADYDIGIIRTRAAQRGPQWDSTPYLYFKGFLLREAGRCGASAHEYSSLYLWQEAAALPMFLRDGRFAVVTDSFGRPEIRTQFALDARRGPGGAARFARMERAEISLDADIPGALAAEVARNREAADRPGMVAAAVGVDPCTWTFTRIALSERDDAGGGTLYEVLHLARPLLDTLQHSGEA